MSFRVPESCRMTKGPLSTKGEQGNNGAFVLKVRNGLVQILCIASDGGGWEHVSASIKDRCPTWGEMSEIKGIFWEPEDAVIQFHPPASEYVNQHPYCLHLWRPIGIEIPRPPSIFVGFK